MGESIVLRRARRPPATFEVCGEGRDREGDKGNGDSVQHGERLVLESKEGVPANS